MNAVLKYPGSKWRIADWIISQIPKHHSYLEPFAGSLAVLFNKPLSNIETVNDLDLNIVNLFSCIRENSERLSKLIEATPYSRYEYDSIYYAEVPGCKYERARQFLIKCWQGHGHRANKYKVGWKNDVQGREKAYAMRYWNDLPYRILEAAERLKQVQVECMPAIKLIKRFKYPNVFIYCDPPYLFNTRTANVTQQYSYEMTDSDHVELLKTLLEHPGQVMISGYQSELYDDTLRGWAKNVIQSNVQSGGFREEVIWMNYKPLGVQMTLLEG